MERRTKPLRRSIEFDVPLLHHPKELVALPSQIQSHELTLMLTTLLNQEIQKVTFGSWLKSKTLLRMYCMRSSQGG